jgi:hypothetical protein
VWLALVDFAAAIGNERLTSWNGLNCPIARLFRSYDALANQGALPPRKAMLCAAAVVRRLV